MTEEEREELVKLMRAYHANYQYDPNRVKGAILMRQAADVIDELTVTIEQMKNERWRHEKVIAAQTEILRAQTEDIMKLRSGKT